MGAGLGGWDSQTLRPMPSGAVGCRGLTPAVPPRVGVMERSQGAPVP